MNSEFFGITDIGRVRKNNEDVWAQIPEKKFFILADGMGGHKAGEVAAEIAVKSICAAVHSLPLDAPQEQVCLLLRESIIKANKDVFDAARAEPSYSGMGTTMTCFLLAQGALVYAHIGDSRLYRYRDKLELLTEDHSLQQTLWTKEAEGPPSRLLRNVITRAIGTHSSVLPDVGVIPLHSKDVYLLCSDGLSDYVPPKTLSALLATPLPLEEMGKKLIAAALEKGGNDNITLLLTRIS